MLGKSSIHTTDKFTKNAERKINQGDLEGMAPGNTELSIGNGYTIDIYGQVIGKNGALLKRIFGKSKRCPSIRIRVNEKDLNGNIISQIKELRIADLMGQYFGPYIEGYAEMKRHIDKEYIVVPKDDNPKHMKTDQLKYVQKKEYDLNGTSISLAMELLLFFKNKKSNIELATLLGVHDSSISRAHTRLKREGRIGKEELNELIILHKTYRIYETLLACDGLKSNLEIVGELRPKVIDKKEKAILAHRVSWVRRKLRGKDKIKEYNTYQQKVNIADVRQELEEELRRNEALAKGKRRTKVEIAHAFGLGIEQVYNYSKRMKERETEESQS